MRRQVIFSSKHPIEMYLLSLTEMCQRFAYWGVGNLLVLYLIKQFSFSIKSATHLFGLYTGTAFLLPILGGFIADKWDYKKPILLGMALSALGCAFMVTVHKSLLLPGLALLAIGGGLFTPSIYSLLGAIYAHKQHIREGGFSIYYAIVNIGTLIGMGVLGYMQTFSWPLVFTITAGVQLVGIIPYRIAIKRLKKLKVQSHYFVSKKEDPKGLALKHHERDRIIVILIMTLVSIVFWMAYNQAPSSMTLFALKYTNRMIGGFEVPSPWFFACETFFLILFAFPLARLHLFLKKIKSGASPPMKTALSLFFMGLCFLVMQRAAVHIPYWEKSGSVSPFYLIAAFGLMALAELFLAPIGLSLVTNLSPHRYRGMLTGVWFACIGVGFYLGGLIAGMMETAQLSFFFDIFAFTSFIPALVLVLFSKKLDQMRHIDSL